jgi:type I restriction enzyme S subunit
MDDSSVTHVGQPDGPEAWESVKLGDITNELRVTYGISDRGLPAHQGVVRAGDIRDGRVTTDQPGCEGAVSERDTRAVLRRGDLVIVLVRRVGDTALVTEEHEGWVATRGVGIIRTKEQHIIRWLRIWLRTPRAQAWIERHVSAHVEPTLSIDALKKMPVPIPPREQIEKVHELVTLIEDKTRLNLGIAADAVDLADAHYGTARRHRASWPTCAFGAVTRASTGRAVTASASEDGISATLVAPSDVLNSRLPYLADTERQALTTPSAICEPGTILVATRPEEARAVLTLLPAVAGRSVLAVRPAIPTDRWWLLHELRFRGEELSRAAQGRQAREITKRAFSRLDIAWPAADVRREFHRVAEPLHGVAQQMLDENRALNETLVTLLRAVSSGTSRLPG